MNQKKAKMIRRHARKLTAGNPVLYRPTVKLLKKAYKSKQKEGLKHTPQKQAK